VFIADTIDVLLLKLLRPETMEMQTVAINARGTRIEVSWADACKIPYFKLGATWPTSSHKNKEIYVPLSPGVVHVILDALVFVEDDVEDLIPSSVSKAAVMSAAKFLGLVHEELPSHEPFGHILQRLATERQRRQAELLTQSSDSCEKCVNCGLLFDATKNTPSSCSCHPIYLRHSFGDKGDWMCSRCGCRTDAPWHWKDECYSGPHVIDGEQKQKHADDGQ
jgi:hypothetical protein